MTNDNKIKQSSGYRQLWFLAGPNIASNILFVMVSFAHIAIVAPFGAETSAAIVAGSRLQFIMFSASMAITVATTALVARAWGSGDIDRASAATTASMTLGLISSAVIGILFYAFAYIMAGWFSLAEESRIMAADYLRVAAVCFSGSAIFMIFSAALRAIGQVLHPLYVTAFTSVVSVIMSYGLAHGLWGLPQLGLTGVILGTSLTQIFAAIYLLIRWSLGGYALRINAKAWLDIDLLSSLTRIGLPAAAEQLLIQISFILFMVLISQAGTDAFAAYGIGITILTVCIVVGLGFGTASAALTGQAIGRSEAGSRDLQAIRQHGRDAMRLAVLVMTLVALITFICRDQLTNVLTTSPPVREHTRYFIMILAAVQPLMAIEFALAGALRGAGDTRFPLVVSICGNMLTRITAGSAVVLAGLHVHWLYSVIVLDYIIKAAMLLWRFNGDRWLLEDKPQRPSALPSLAGVSRAAIRLFYAPKERD